jgi:pyruvate dehydrogenase E1 component alpha subunit
MGTSVKRASSNQELFSRGEAFGIPGVSVDGMDVLAVKEAGAKALEHARSGKGPFILGMQTYRYRGHSMSDPARYRSREEVSKVRSERDPIDRARQYVLDLKSTDEEGMKKIDSDIKKLVSNAADYAQESPEPDISELYTDILVEI